MTLMTNVRRNTIQSAADIPIAKMFPIDRLVFLAEVTPPRFSSLFLEGDRSWRRCCCRKKRGFRSRKHEVSTPQEPFAENTVGEIKCIGYFTSRLRIGRVGVSRTPPKHVTSDRLLLCLGIQYPLCLLAHLIW